MITLNGDPDRSALRVAAQALLGVRPT